MGLGLWLKVRVDFQRLRLHTLQQRDGSDPCEDLVVRQTVAKYELILNILVQLRSVHSERHSEDCTGV